MKSPKRIALSSDHAGYQLKQELLQFLKELDYEAIDLGTDSEESVDYPDFGEAMGRAVADGQADLGVSICGSGIGIGMAANKVAGARAATVHNVKSAELARAHNDANIICLGARLLKARTAKKAVKVFLETDFEGGRHQARVKKLDAIK